MNEMIGVAVYLVLALVIAVGVRAAKAGSGKKLNSVTAPARPSVAARARIAKEAQSRKPDAQHEHALPWVIPTAIRKHFPDGLPAYGGRVTLVGIDASSTEERRRWLIAGLLVAVGVSGRYFFAGGKA